MHIPSDKRSKLYELTYLVSAQLTSDEVKTIDSAVEKLITKNKGVVKNTEEWGKKQLAYTIKHAGKKHNEAAFKHCVIQFETDKAFAFEKELYLNQSVLRHLFVIAEEAPAKEVKKEEKAA
jgi:small subunit ribosomal protein S6